MLIGLKDERRNRKVLSAAVAVWLSFTFVSEVIVASMTLFLCYVSLVLLA